MLIIGLTGSIASGKSTIASAMKRYHFPVFDSDKEVHKLLAPHGAAVTEILDYFPDSGSLEKGIDRKRLGAMVFQDKQALTRLESILHPQVGQARTSFLQQAHFANRRAVILDVPLLFETKTDLLCDVTMMAWAPLRVIKHRALRRPHMTAEKLAQIIAQQMPQHEKQRLVDVTITTALGHGVMMRQILRLLSHLRLR